MAAWWQTASTPASASSTVGGVADIADHQFAADVVGPAVVHGGGERIEPTNVMARGLHRLRDMRSDEPGRAGHENAHDCSKA